MCDLWMDVDVALAEVPVNILPLLDDTDFKTRETAVAFNAAGMDLVWNFVTPAGAMTQTAVTPTSAGVYDWANQGDGMYSIEIPASGGGSINNDTEGYGWFTGVATGVLPWRGPVIGFRAAGLNDLLIESAFSATRGLAGTALPAVAAEAAGGLYTRGSGAGQINQQTNGQIDSNLERWINVAPLALSSQRVQVLVGAMSNGVIAAATFAANALDAVWSTATRLLTAGTNIVLAKGTGVTGFNDLDAAGVRGAVGLASANLDTQLSGVSTLNAAGVRAAVGLASANLDTQLAAIAAFLDTEVAAILAAVDTEVAAIKAKTDNLPASPAAVGSAMTLTSGERDSVAAALLDLSNALETGLTVRGALRLIAAASAGKLSGAATTTVTIRNAVQDSKARLTATVDADGNRTAITADVT